jgi:cell division protein FtsL
MALYFCIILCACLITGYFLLKKSNNEVSHLVAVFAAISLILGLIFAPWQILLLLLVAVLISTSYEYYTSKVVRQETESLQQPVPTSEEDCHNLIYRGASYRAHSNVNLDEENIQPVTYKLSFRGSSYFVNKTAQREVQEQGS